MHGIGGPLTPRMLRYLLLLLAIFLFALQLLRAVDAERAIFYGLAGWLLILMATWI